MKFAALSSFVILSVLAGCAADSSETGESADAVVKTARTEIELKSSSDAASLPAKLFALMNTFKDDADLRIGKAIESQAFVLTGPDPLHVSRSLECEETHLISAVLGRGVSNTAFHACTFSGLDKTRAGGALPRVTVAFGEQDALAGKLTTLLEKGEKKGGFGIVKNGNERPQCCDMPVTLKYELSDATMSLVCTVHAGGFTGVEQDECTLSHKIAPNE